MPSYRNTSSKRHSRAGTNHRAVERAIDSVLQPGAEAGPPDIFGDPTRLAAHEIRSHLGLLTGYLSMLQEGALGQLPDALAPVLEEMTSKTRAISRLVEDMLEDARFQDGRLHLSVRFVDLREVVEAATAEMRATLSAKHSLTVHLPERPLVAEVDPGRVRTILRNLLDNSAKYSPDGGPIECRLEPGDGVAVLSVADRGIGISAADADLVFRRFGRAHSSEASISGVGLGLYICRTLARLHGGDVRVKPRSGPGSEFLVTLPLKQQAVADTAAHEPHSQSSQASRAAN